MSKIPHLNDGIELTRRKFAEAKFDDEGCELGLRALHGYEWLYDELHKTTRTTPAPGWAKNGADAFRQWAQGYREKGGTWAAQASAAGHKGISGRKYAQKRSRRGTALNPTLEHVV